MHSNIWFKHPFICCDFSFIYRIAYLIVNKCIRLCLKINWNWFPNNLLKNCLVYDLVFPICFYNYVWLLYNDFSKEDCFQRIYSINFTNISVLILITRYYYADYFFNKLQKYLRQRLYFRKCKIWMLYWIILFLFVYIYNPSFTFLDFYYTRVLIFPFI